MPTKKKKPHVKAFSFLIWIYMDLCECQEHPWLQPWDESAALQLCINLHKIYKIHLLYLPTNLAIAMVICYN